MAACPTSAAAAEAPLFFEEELAHSLKELQEDLLAAHRRAIIQLERRTATPAGIDSLEEAGATVVTDLPLPTLPTTGGIKRQVTLSEPERLSEPGSQMHKSKTLDLPGLYQGLGMTEGPRMHRRSVDSATRGPSLTPPPWEAPRGSLNDLARDGLAAHKEDVFRNSRPQSFSGQSLSGRQSRQSLATLSSEATHKSSRQTILKSTPRSGTQNTMASASGCFHLNPLWLQCKSDGRATGPWRSRQQARGTMTSTRSSNRRSFLGVRPQESTTNSEEAAASQGWTLAPGSKALLCWEMISLLGVSYDFVIVPLGFLDLTNTDFNILWSRVYRCYWTMDILFSFFKGYIDAEGSAVRDLRLVALHYIRTWLLLDAVVLMCDWVEAEAGRSGRLLKVLRLLRLLRMFRTRQITEFLSEYIHSEQVILIACIFRVIVLLTGACHLSACAWFGIGHMDEPKGWVASTGLDLASPWDQYITSFHWSLGALSGENIIAPATTFERTFACVILLLFFMFSAGFVSSITTSMTRLQLLASQEAKDFSTLRRYLNDHDISGTLATKVQRNAQHAMRQHKKMTEEANVSLLKLVSQPLLSELHFELHMRHLQDHAFFQNYTEVNPGGMRKVCHTAISFVRAHPGDILFLEFEVPQVPQMLFILEGKLSYERDMEKEVVTSRLIKTWAVEAVLWTSWCHLGTLRAETSCTIMLLNAASFQQVVHTFPSNHPQLYGVRFVEQLNRCGSEELLSDMGEPGPELEHMVSSVFFPEDLDSKHRDEELPAEKATFKSRMSVMTSRAAFQPPSSTKIKNSDPREETEWSDLGLS